MSNIFGYPNYISGGTGGGNTVLPGGGLGSTTNPDGTITIYASGSYITYFYEPSIIGSRQLVAGNNVTLVDGSTSITINAQVTGSGATSSGSYATINTEASLPQSRRLANGSGITFVDNGAGSTFDIGVANTITNAPLVVADYAGGTIFPNRRGIEVAGGLTIQDTGTALLISSSALPSGTVTSVGLVLPVTTFNVTNSPVTSSGDLTATFINQAVNTVLAGPSGGGAGTPGWRMLTAPDLPIAAGTGISLAQNASGGLTITSTASSGGGGVSSVALALPVDTFTISGSPVTTSGTLTGSYASQGANTFHAGPSGNSGTPLWRKMVGIDLPISAGSNIVLSTDATGGLSISSVASGGGGGTVTSVAQAVPASLLTISGSPITTAGTLTLGLTNAASATFWRGPTSGAAGTPSYGAIVATDLPTGIPAINIGAGSVDNTEFGYLDGVTSAIQTQFSNKQPLDATLTALAAYNTNGVLTQTAADTFVGRTITGTANEVTVTDGDGVSGNPTLSLPTGIDATKIADGSVTSTEFQYINTLSSNAQTQIDGKAANTEAFVTLGTTSGLTNERSLAVAGGLTIQDLGAGNAVTISASALQPLDATLTALAAYNTTGFITQTAPDTFSGRTLAVAGGLTIQEAGSVITISASGVSGGSGGLTASTITTSATASVNTVTFVDLTSGNVNLALVSPTSQGGKEIVVKIVANAVPPNTLTINASSINGSARMDGQATLSSQYVYDCFSFISDNTNLWAIRV